MKYPVALEQFVRRRLAEDNKIYTEKHVNSRIEWNICSMEIKKQPKR